MEVKRGVVVGIQSDGFVGVVLFGDEDGGEICAKGFKMIPFSLLEAEEILLVFLVGRLFFLEEGEGLFVFLLLLIEVVLLGSFFFPTLLGVALVFAALLQVGEFLLLVLDFSFENEAGSGLDGVIVHGLKLFAGGVATINDFVDAIADPFCSFEKGLVGWQLVEFGRAVLKSFEVEASGKADDIRGECVDEIGDGVVGFAEHLFDVTELEEDHQLDCYERLVGSSNAANVEIHLVGDDTEFFKSKGSRNFFPVAVVTVPLKLVKSFGGSGNVDSGSVENAVCDFAFIFGVDHDGFVGIKMGGFFGEDIRVKEGIEPQVTWAGPVFGVSIAEGNDEVFAFGCVEPREGLDPGEWCEDGCWSRDEVPGSVGVPADDRFAVLNGFWKDHGIMEYGFFFRVRS